jgi:phenylacetate-CoA ligase
MSGGQTEKQVRLIMDFAPEVIMVTPSYMLAILDELRRQSIDPRQTSLRFGIFGAEPWTEAMRSEIEDAIGLQATDIYGLSELMGPGVGAAVGGDRTGTTLWEDHFYPEIIDPDTGAVLPDGEEGELVLTSLTREAMPVLRYRTRDITRLLPGTGMPFRRMQRISGRSDDMLIVRGVNLFPSQVEEVVVACSGLAPHFEIEVNRTGRLDTIVISVEPRFGVEESSAETAAQSLPDRIKAATGLSAEVRLVAAGSLPRSSGKAIRVRDRRLDELA